MSLESWKKEFYPTKADSLKAQAEPVNVFRRICFYGDFAPVSFVLNLREEEEKRKNLEYNLTWGTKNE